MRMRQQNGFTLIELMITLVILAIITAIAYPMYRNYIIQSRRADATTALTQIAALEEKFFTECASGSGAGQVGYITDLGGSIQTSATLGSAQCSGLGYINLVSSPSGAATSNTVNGYYNLTITSNTLLPDSPVGATIANSFRITAAPIAGTTQATDGAFTITNTGSKWWDKNNDGVWAATERTWNK